MILHACDKIIRFANVDFIVIGRVKSVNKMHINYQSQKIMYRHKKRTAEINQQSFLNSGGGIRPAGGEPTTFGL